MRRLAALCAVFVAVATAACGGTQAASQLGNGAPRARLSAPLYAPLGQPVVFDAGSSFDPDGTITEYTFSFSDGSNQVTLPTPEAMHVFTQTGAYEVAVVVRDDAGTLARATQLVVVRSDATPCQGPSTCALGADCRGGLCYVTGAGAGSGIADCKADSECGTGLSCRAGLCLTRESATP